MTPKIYFTVQRRCAVGATTFNRAPILPPKRPLTVQRRLTVNAKFRNPRCNDVVHY